MVDADDDKDVSSVSPDTVGDKKTASHLEKRFLYGREVYYGVCQGMSRCAKGCQGVTMVWKDVMWF